MSEARQELFSVLESVEMERVPVVVIANKQDLPRALKAHEIAPVSYTHLTLPTSDLV